MQLVVLMHCLWPLRRMQNLQYGIQHQSLRNGSDILLLQVQAASTTVRVAGSATEVCSKAPGAQSLFGLPSPLLASVRVGYEP